MHIQIKICEYQDDDHHVMLYYNRTAKDCQSLHCKPALPSCRCSIYRHPMFIWSYGFMVAQLVAQSMLQPHNQCCSAENRSHMAPHPCCAATHTHRRPLWGKSKGDTLANTPSDFCDQIILKSNTCGTNSPQSPLKALRVDIIIFIDVKWSHHYHLQNLRVS